MKFRLTQDVSNVTLHVIKTKKVNPEWPKLEDDLIKYLAISLTSDEILYIDETYVNSMHFYFKLKKSRIDNKFNLSSIKVVRLHNDKWNNLSNHKF